MIERQVAHTADNVLVKGAVDGASRGVTEEPLHKGGYGRTARPKESSRGRTGIERHLPFLSKVRIGSIIEFSRGLAMLLESGIDIITSLQLLSEQSFPQQLARIITNLKEEIREGNSFTQAINNHPDIFDDTYRHVVWSGEQAGLLELGLANMAEYLEKREEIGRSIKRAMMYPAVVLGAGFVVCIMMVTVVLPPLVGVFAETGAEMPTITKLVMGVSNFLIDYKLPLFGGLVPAIALMSVYRARPSGKRAMDKLILRIPLIKSYVIRNSLLQFSQTASMLLRSGVALPAVVDVSSRTVRNTVIKKSLREARDRSVSQSLSAVSMFPGSFAHMLAVGEKTGELEPAFSKITSYYRRINEQQTGTLVSMLEPVLTLMVGVMVALIAISVISPMYSLMDTM